MVQVRGLYANIDKEVRDLLYKDFHTGLNCTFSNHVSYGAITHSGRRICDSFVADSKTLLKSEIISDVKAGIDSKTSASMKIEHAPGMKTVFDFFYPDRESGKGMWSGVIVTPSPGAHAHAKTVYLFSSSLVYFVPIFEVQMELQYQTEFVGISSSIGLIANPVVGFSCMFGEDDLSVGTNVSINTATLKLTECKFGLRTFCPRYITSLNLNAKDVTLTASIYHLINCSTYTALGYEFALSPSTHMSNVTVGVQRKLDPFTMVKACVDNFGKVRAAIQRECKWGPKSLLTVSGAVNMMSILKSAKVGLSVAF
ncbi:hypothetical protein IFM89_002821 [Coptis chinensis]|uniref:Uncharacterized protein n=1 Tax=Coptis chinensis TaxID=261450 RepID=A0A835HSQ5_9MAGN|nr:hypothetical protein IFM89_002821 [Coptis chinensis]